MTGAPTEPPATEPPAPPHDSDAPQEAIDQPGDAEIASALEAICAVLLRRTGHDFRQYKEGTLVRRVRRRVALVRADSVAAYLGLLEEDPAEPQSLLETLLIGVTQFFRDPDAFAALEELVLPALLHGRPARAPLRVWVPGCASGEEAYSIAMLLREHVDRAGLPRPIHIFATDIDGRALARARRGRYPDHIAEDVSAERLARFFTRDVDGFHATRELRTMCVFSEHSLIKDPPFSSLDLISCRNILIYMEVALQRKLVPLLHYALRPAGFLFLGPSEGVSVFPELFVPMDKKNRIFRRNEAVPRPRLDLPLSSGAAGVRASSHAAGGAEGPDLRPGMLVSLERTILTEYTPPSLVIDAQGEIHYTAGPTGLYLQSPPGSPSHNIFDLAHGRLGLELRTALSRSVAKGGKVVRRGVPVEVEGRERRLVLTVRPMPGAGMFLVVLQEAPSPPAAEGEDDEEQSVDTSLSVIAQLEAEQRAGRAELQAVRDELGSAVEELKSSNEELLSMNEELQSANEELQASREELQTLNIALQERVADLRAANADLQNHIAATDIATLFLDDAHRITRFTPAAARLLHLIDADVGRPVADLALRFAGLDLRADLDLVRAAGHPVEQQVQAEDGAWFMERVLPYRTSEGDISGAVVTFADITVLKRAEEELWHAKEAYRALGDNSPDSVDRLDRAYRHVYINAPGAALVGRTPEEVTGKSNRELGVPEPTLSLWEDRVQSVFDTGLPLDVEDAFPTVDGSRYFHSRVVPERAPDGAVATVLCVSRDITERRRLEAELLQAHKMETIGRLAGGVAHDFNNLLTVIMGNATLAREALGDERRPHEELEELLQAAQRATDLTQQLLTFSRRQLISPRTVDLNDVVLRMDKMLRRLIGADVELVTLPDAGQPYVHVDPGQIEQVIVNLAVNARDAMPDGGKLTLHIRTVVVDEDASRRFGALRPGEHVRLSVSDTGEGMTKETMEHAFEPFFTTKPKGKGTGLGLATVYGTIRQHGGQIALESEPGKGTTIHIDLPRASAPVILSAPREPERQAQGGTEAVLVVEDETLVRRMVVRALSDRGYQVQEASNGEEALRLLASREAPIDLLVTDVIMPQMGGRELAERLRAQRPAIAVLFVSGYTDSAFAQQAPVDGRTDFLQKPFSMEVLARKVRETLDRAAASSSSG